MTYLDIIEVFEAAARTVDPDGTYYRGRLADISLASVSELKQAGKNENLIYLEDTTQITPNRDVNTIEQWRFRLGFFRQDSTSSESMEANQVQENEESREIIFNETLTLARKYLDALYNEDSIQIVNEPQLNQVTRIFQGTLTGWGTEIVIQLAVGCEYETSIADAVYQNSDQTFEQSIKRGEVYIAPDITVTDSDGSAFTQPANKDVTCTPSASPATAVLKNTAGATISTTSIDPGTTEDITAPDATAVLKNSAGAIIIANPIPSNVSEDMTAPDATAVIKNSLGTTLDTEAIPSNVSEDIVMPDVNNVNSDGSVVPTPAGVAYTCTPQVKITELYFAFEAGDDTSALATNSGTTWTLTAISDDGASGAITVSDNGAAYGAFVNPTTTANGETIQVKRATTTGAGWVLITGTYA